MAPPLLALNINIEPGSYSGPYNPAGQGTRTGPSSIILPAGNNYRVYLDNTHSAFHFNVDAAGNVSSLNPDAASGSGSTLTFNTVHITIDPAAYTGTYSLNGRFSGVQGFDLLPGVNNYGLWLSNTGNALRIDVDAGGNVTSQNAAAATGVGNTLVFNTTTIHVDPGSYKGSYVMGSNNGEGGTGVRSFTVLPGLPNYSMHFSSTLNTLTYDVDPVGQVISDNVAAATGVGNTLVFNTTTVTIDPMAYPSNYYVFPLTPGTASVSGPQTLDLLP